MACKGRVVCLTQGGRVCFACTKQTGKIKSFFLGKGGIKKIAIPKQPQLDDSPGSVADGDDASPTLLLREFIIDLGQRPNVGVQLHTKPTLPGIWVSKVLTGGPAAKAKIKSGQVIAKIEDEDVLYCSLPEVVHKMKTCGRQFTVSIIHRSCVHLLSQLRPRGPEETYQNVSATGAKLFDLIVPEQIPSDDVHAETVHDAPGSPSTRRANSYLFGDSPPSPVKDHNHSDTCDEAPVVVAQRKQKRPMGPRALITMTVFDQSGEFHGGLVPAVDDGEADSPRILSFDKPTDRMSRKFVMGIGLLPVADGQEVTKITSGGLADGIGLAVGDKISSVCVNGSWISVRKDDFVNITELFKDAFGQVVLRLVGPDAALNTISANSIGGAAVDDAMDKYFSANSIGGAAVDDPMDKYFIASPFREADHDTAQYYDDLAQMQEEAEDTSKILVDLKARVDEVKEIGGSGTAANSQVEFFENFEFDDAVQAARRWWLEQDADVSSYVNNDDNGAASTTQIMQDLKDKVDQMRELAAQRIEATKPGSTKQDSSDTGSAELNPTTPTSHTRCSADMYCDTSQYTSSGVVKERHESTQSTLQVAVDSARRWWLNTKQGRLPKGIRRKGKTTESQLEAHNDASQAPLDQSDVDVDQTPATTTFFEKLKTTETMEAMGKAVASVQSLMHNRSSESSAICGREPDLLLYGLPSEKNGAAEDGKASFDEGLKKKKKKGGLKPKWRQALESSLQLDKSKRRNADKEIAAKNKLLMGKKANLVPVVDANVCVRGPSKPKWRQALESSLQLDKSKRRNADKEIATKNKLLIGKKARIEQRRQKGKVSSSQTKQRDWVAEIYTKKTAPTTVDVRSAAPTAAASKAAAASRVQLQTPAVRSNAFCNAQSTPDRSEDTGARHPKGLNIAVTQPGTAGQKLHHDLKEIIKLAQSGQSASITDVKEALNNWRSSRTSYTHDANTPTDNSTPHTSPRRTRTSSSSAAGKINNGPTTSHKGPAATRSHNPLLHPATHSTPDNVNLFFHAM